MNETTSPEPSRDVARERLQRGLALALDLDVDAVVVEPALQVGERRCSRRRRAAARRAGSSATWSATGLASRTPMPDERRRATRYTPRAPRRRAGSARARSSSTSGLRISAMTPATMNSSSDRAGGAREHAHDAEQPAAAARAGPSAGRRPADARRRAAGGRAGSAALRLVGRSPAGVDGGSLGLTDRPSRAGRDPLRRRRRRRAGRRALGAAARRCARSTRSTSSSSTARTPPAASASRRRSPTSCSRRAST